MANARCEHPAQAVHRAHGQRLECLNAADPRVLEVMGPQVDVMTDPRAARRGSAELNEACASLEPQGEKTRREDIRLGRA